ncbi:MAG TPA: penicillin-binding protein [Candidatus Paceibacterota bacterium]
MKTLDKTIRTLKKKWKNIPWKKILLGAAAAAFLFIGGGLIWASLLKLPDISTFEARKIANSSKITDRTGEIVLYDIHQSVRRTEVPLDAMSENIKNAVISIEDTHFYEHNGIRPTSIARAALGVITSASLSQGGGSTITQQIIKNTLLNTDRSITRKLKEWVLAVRLERHFSKEQILQIYLNDAPFGSTIYGVEEAAQAFYSKPAIDLTIGESAYLAAMLPAPSYYSPFGNHKDRLTNRKNLVLRKMLEYGRITDSEYQSALAEEVVFNQAASNSIKAPHFVFSVLDYLQEKYGEDVMESGGYTIKTTIDYDLQLAAEKAISEQAPIIERQYRASNSALTAIDPSTGQVLAMVGSRDYFDKQIDGAFNVATAFRQPGSSFKPFVYATAFAKGYTPETILFDVPTEFSTNCTAARLPKPGYTEKDCYHPSNFDDKYKGPLSLRSSIAESRNVPSVKLLYLVGVDEAVKTAHALGISTLQNPQEIGLSLVLGGGEVSLLDITSAYGVFANSGVRNPTTSILEVRDRKGDIIEEFEASPTQVMDKNAVLTLNDVLSDPVARTPTFGSSITIENVAVKTGTTNDNKDAWIIGYTPTLAVGVWSGNNDNKSMASGGSTVSGPAWRAFMAEALKKIPAVPFEKPIPDPEFNSLKPVLRGEWMGNMTIEIDSVTGLRATENTPMEARIERVITDVQDILYWVDKKDPRGPAPSNPASDPQFSLWNPAVQVWWQNNAANYNAVALSDLPTDYETVHSNNNNNDLRIDGLPKQMALTDTQVLTITNKGEYPLNSVDLYIDNSFIATLPSAPFRFTLTPSEYNYKTGTHTIKIIATNSIYTKGTVEETVLFTQ